MNRSAYLIAATALGIGAFAQPASAQDFTTATFGGTTMWVGGGVQFLSLPDIRFTGKGSPGDFHRQKNSESDWLDFGPAVGGGFETALGVWGNSRVTGGVKGFWANVDTDDTTRCNNPPGGCIIVDPTGVLARGPTLRTKTDRDVDYWGGQAELKFGRLEPVQVKPALYRNDYFIIGADVRGIDQDNKLRGHSFAGTDVFTYKESLDTTYVGGYIGVGGEYSLPFFGSGGGLYDRLGLRTFINLRGGLYNADTDYDGRFAYNFFDFNSKLSKSADDLAFIGTVSLETRKQIGPRTSISLWTDYEYISSVPKMRYADGGDGRPTRIDDEGVFASRTMLRLNISFGGTPGPAPAYAEPLK
jgi:hypothetical protein